MSNVIKAGQFPGGQISVETEKNEKIIIDSNPRANLFLSGLHKTLEAKQETEDVRMGALPANVEAAIKEQAALILNQAREEEKSIKDQALKEAKLQKKAIFDEAREQGYKVGYESGLAALQDLENKLKERMVLNQQEYQRQIDELEPLFSKLVIQYVERLTGFVMEENRPVIGYLMKEAIRQAEPGKMYVIHVPSQDYEQALEHEEELRALVSHRASLEILSDNGLQPGECKLETETCVIDSGMGTRLEILKENLRLLAENV